MCSVVSWLCPELSATGVSLMALIEHVHSEGATPPRQKYFLLIATERLEFINSFLADNKYHVPVAVLGEGGVHGPNPMQRESKAATKWRIYSLLTGGSVPTVYHPHILSSREYLQPVC